MWREIFHGLRQPSADDEELVGRATNEGLTCFVAKDRQGLPALLFRVIEATGPARLVDVSLENLSVQHRLACRVALSAGTITDRFTVIRCRSAEPQLQAFFIDSLEGVFSPLSGPLSSDQIATVIARLAALFQTASSAPRGSSQGLWVELLMIVKATTPVSLLKSWHEAWEDRFDFAVAGERLEVKSALGTSRRHHFSLDQLTPIAGTRVTIASVLLERTAAGTSLGELWDRARRLCGGHPDLSLKIDQVCMSVLGNGWRNARQVRFDEASALASLCTYDARDIPSVPPALPPEVTDVRFVSDLTHLAGTTRVDDLPPLARSLPYSR